MSEMTGRAAASRDGKQLQQRAGHVMKSAQRLQLCSGTSMGTFAGQDAHDD